MRDITIHIGRKSTVLAVFYPCEYRLKPPVWVFS